MNYNSIGIDYGMGKTNIDIRKGIRYGVVSQNEIDLSYWCDNQEFHYTYSCPSCSTVLKKGQDAKVCPSCRRRLDESDFDCLDPDYFFYKKNGYYIQQSYDDTDLFILKSPFYTRCAYCSPCAPGAGYIMSTNKLGPRVYCLGPEFFEDGKNPYPMWPSKSVRGKKVSS